MYGCEILFTQEQGRAMMDMVERITGAPCPCTVGEACPILPLGKAQERPVPVPRVA
jgi:hypothetical protein